MNRDSRLPQDLWDRLPPEAQAYIQALAAHIVALEAAVRQWQEQLQQDSRTSSRPPSSDPPQARSPRPRREPSGRRPGGQPGHEGQTRALVPVEEVDVVMPVKPTRCPRCQSPWHGEDGPPQRHQVTDIPPVQPGVIASQWPRLVCPAWGEMSRAALPTGGHPGEFGPRVQAIAALGTGA
jgi:transposase